MPKLVPEFEGLVEKFGIPGVAALVLLPVLVRVATGVGKPIAKAIIKGGIVLYKKGKGVIAEVGGTLETLVVEAKAELALAHAASAPTTGKRVVITPHAETAAQYVTQRVPIAYLEESVASVMARLPGNTFDSAEAIYVVDDRARLCGLVRLLELLIISSNRKLGDIVTIHPPTAYLEEDLEEVVGLAVQYGLATVPIVDREHVFKGVVTAQTSSDILRREHIEDLHRLAGTERENHYAGQVMEASLPWLLVGLGGSILATFVVSRFEQVLEERVVVAFFVPGIVYLADAIGTQTEAIARRRLFLSHVPLQDYLIEELRAGFLIGLALGGISLALVSIAFGDFRLGLAVALSILTAGEVATTVRLLLPWLLDKAGKDPAFGSGVVATVIQNVLSLLIYFVVVQLLWVY